MTLAERKAAANAALVYSTLARAMEARIEVKKALRALRPPAPEVDAACDALLAQLWEQTRTRSC